jgi:hypothetical protein
VELLEGLKVDCVIIAVAHEVFKKEDALVFSFVKLVGRLLRVKVRYCF